MSSIWTCILFFPVQKIWLIVNLLQDGTFIYVMAFMSEVLVPTKEVLLFQRKTPEQKTNKFTRTDENLCNSF